MLLRLWEELSPNSALNHFCLFCAKPLPIHILFDGQAEVEHILPSSRTFDDSAANKVIAHRSCNREKAHQPPSEQRGGTPRWDGIAEQVAHIDKTKPWLFAPDAMDRFEKDGGF